MQRGKFNKINYSTIQRHENVLQTTKKRGTIQWLYGMSNNDGNSHVPKLQQV